MYESIKEKIEEIIEITKKCPANLQEKCFELLVAPLIKMQPTTHPEKEKIKSTKKEEEKKHEVLIPLEVKAFIQQYDVSEEKLHKLYLIELNNVIEIYKISTTKKAEAQIQISLLTALKNAILGNKFKFSIEYVRKKCEDYKAYDRANFKSIFKKQSNKKLFKSLEDKENIELSTEGKQKLADIILNIAK